MDIINTDPVFKRKIASSLYGQCNSRWASPESESMSNRLSEELDIEMSRLQEMMSSLEELDQELKGDQLNPMTISRLENNKDRKTKHKMDTVNHTVKGRNLQQVRDNKRLCSQTKLKSKSET